MKMTIILLCISIVGNFVFGQKQKGIVVLQNSGKKTLGQVSIISEGGVATTSDNQGRFELYLPGYMSGQKITIQEIKKSGYEVVNKKMVEQWTYAPAKEYRVDMCLKADLEKSIARYYEIGKSNCYDRYKRSMELLEKEKKQAKLDEEKYRQKRSKMLNELQHAEDLLDYYAERFACINIDYLEVLDRKALEYVDSGNFTEAIALYEKEQFVRKYIDKNEQRQLLDEELEGMIPSLQMMADILTFAGGKENYEKAGHILKMIASKDTTHVQRTSDYAYFAAEQNQYKEAIFYFKRLLRHNKEVMVGAEALTRLGDLYKRTGLMEVALNYYGNALEEIEKFRDRHSAVAGMLMMDVCNNMSEILLNLGKFEKAVEMSGIGLEIALKLEELNPGNLTENIIIGYNTLGTSYFELKNFKQAPHCYLLAKKWEAQCQDIEKNSNWITAYNLAKVYIANGEFQKAEPILKEATETVERLRGKNPLKYEIAYMRTYAGWGAYYLEQNNYFKAEEILEKVWSQLKVDQTMRIANKDLYHDVLYNLSNCYYDRGMYGKAMPLLVELQDYIGPDPYYDFIIARHLVSCSYNLSKFREAIEYGEKALNYFQRIDKSSVEESEIMYLYQNIAFSYAALHEFDAAFMNMERADKYTSDRNTKISAQLNFLSLYIYQREPGKVMEGCLKIASQVELLKQNNPFLFYIHNVYLFLSYHQLKRYEEAKEKFQEIEKMIEELDNKRYFSDYVSRYIEYAILCYECLDQRGYETAMVKAKRMLDILKEERREKYAQLAIDYYVVSSFAHIKQQQYREGMEDMNQALGYIDEIEAINYEIYAYMRAYLEYNLGYVSYTQKKLYDAWIHFENAFSIFFTLRQKFPSTPAFAKRIFLNCSLFLDQDMVKTEQEMREYEKIDAPLLQISFRLFVNAWQRNFEEKEVKKFLSYMKNRSYNHSLTYGEFYRKSLNSMLALPKNKVWEAQINDALDYLTK